MTIDQLPQWIRPHAGSRLTAIEKKHRRCVQLNKYSAAWSLYIDEAYREKEAMASRWDYYVRVILRNSAVAVFFEPHTCTTCEVSVMLKKYEWLKTKLLADLHCLIRQTNKQLFIWVPIKSNKIRQGTPQYRQLALSKIVIKKIIDDSVVG